MNVEFTESVVRVTGEIDLSNIAVLNSTLREAESSSPHGFIIDLSDATYIDSAGIQSILTAYHHLKRTNGRLSIVVKNKAVQDLLYIIRLDILK